MADTLADLWEEGSGALVLLGARTLNTVPVDSSETGISVSFANVQGTPFDNSDRFAAPDATPLSDDEWVDFILSAPFAGITLGNPGRNRLGTLAGILCQAYEGDLYDRIHINPSTIALGNVLADTNVTFELWNAFFTAQNMTSITESGATSLTLNQPTPPGAVPTVLEALASFTYDIDIDDVGPADIDALYTFNTGFELDAKSVDFTTAEVLEGDDSLDWSVSDTWTISFWWKPTTASNTAVFSITPSSGEGGFNAVEFSYHAGVGAYRVKIVDQGDLNDFKVRDYPAETPDFDEWVNFTIVKSASGPEADALRLYRNGAIVSWTVIGVDDHVDQLASNRTLRLTTETGTSLNGQGIMHSWCQWTTELTNAEIAAIYNLGAGDIVDLRQNDGVYVSSSTARHYYRLAIKVEPDIGEDLGTVPRDLDVSTGITDADIVSDAPSNVLGTGWLTSIVTLALTGSRITLFAHCPQRGYSESLSWLTDIIESWDGTEQRIRARKLPRQTFEITYLMADQNERSTAQNTLFGNLGMFYGVPLFHFARDLGADLSIGDTVITVDTTNADFRSSTAETSELVVLWRDYDDFEVATIALSGVTPTTVTVTQPLAKAHTTLGKTLVIPIQISLLNDGTGWETYQSGDVQRFSCDWLAEEVADLADLTGLTTHEGTIVFDDPNFINGNTLPESLHGKFEVFDSGTGRFETAARRLAPELKLTKGFETSNEAEAFTLRQRLYGLLGRQKTFFIPSFRKDFILVNNIGGADTSIDVEPTEFTRFNPDTLAPFGDIMIELNDGTKFFRELIGTEVGIGLPDREELEIKTTLGTPVTIAEVKRISLLYKVRMDSDTITIIHNDRGVYTVRIPLAGVTA